MKLRRAQIGTVLIACNIPAFVELIEPAFGVQRIAIIFRVPDLFPDIAIPYSLFLLVMATGFAFYVSDRKEYLNLMRGSKILSVLLTILGFTLFTVSLAFLGMVSSSLLGHMTSYWGPPLGLRDFAVFLLILSWCGLGLISSILSVVDGSRISGIRTVSD